MAAVPLFRDTNMASVTLSLYYLFFEYPVCLCTNLLFRPDRIGHCLAGLIFSIKRYQQKQMGQGQMREIETSGQYTSGNAEA